MEDVSADNWIRVFEESLKENDEALRILAKMRFPLL